MAAGGSGGGRCDVIGPDDAAMEEGGKVLCCYMLNHIIRYSGM